MKIPRPAKPEAPPFKRKRAPPPQATKLLVASLAAALVFMAALAIVFVPRYLEGLDQRPSTLLHLELNTTGGAPRIVVTYAALNLGVADFNATLHQGNGTLASLSSGLAGGNATLSFTDANGDGLLDPGDYFTVHVTAQALYTFEVWQLDVGYRVGLVTWTGVPGP